MGLIQLGCWLVGEFGEMLANGQAINEDGSPVNATGTQIIDVYDLVLDEHDRRGDRSDTIICWALTAMSKLTIRLNGTTERVKEIIESFADHQNVEIQQRACEYINIFKAGKWEEEERTSIFEPIPFKGDENMLVDTSNRKVMGDEEDEVSPDMVSKKVSALDNAGLGLDLDLMLGEPAPQTS
jgi:hypothetical protein